LASQVREGCPLDGNACFGVRELRSVIPIVDLYQQVARFDGLVVFDGDRLDKTRDLRRQRGDFTPNVRIIGRFNEPADDPPIPTEPGHRANERGAGDNQKKAFP